MLEGKVYWVMVSVSTLILTIWILTQDFVDRYTEIERENRILLEKMTSIMQTNNRSTIYSANAAMYSSIQNPPHTSSSMPPLAQHKRSLNKDARKRELLKITLEN